jgi:monothiol glutaredoxin
MWNKDKIRQTVEQHKVVVFAKGTKQQPMCGFSARAIDVLNRAGKPFEVVNIFDDPDIRPSLVEFSSWPTTPQVFIDGELIGGSDIALEMFESGELQKKLDAAFAKA